MTPSMALLATCFVNLPFDFNIYALLIRNATIWATSRIYMHNVSRNARSYLACAPFAINPILYAVCGIRGRRGTRPCVGHAQPANSMETGITATAGVRPRFIRAGRGLYKMGITRTQLTASGCFEIHEIHGCVALAVCCYKIVCTRCARCCDQH